MRIKSYSHICKKNKLFAEKEYKVLQISNCMGESPVDLSFKIKDELGNEVWVEDWDCEEIPRIDRFAYMRRGDISKIEGLYNGPNKEG